LTRQGLDIRPLAGLPLLLIWSRAIPALVQFFPCSPGSCFGSFGAIRSSTLRTSFRASMMRRIFIATPGRRRRVGRERTLAPHSRGRSLWCWASVPYPPLSQQPLDGAPALRLVYGPSCLGSLSIMQHHHQAGLHNTIRPAFIIHHCRHLAPSVDFLCNRKPVQVTRWKPLTQLQAYSIIALWTYRKGNQS
jgi:hypothetical protein